MSIQKMDLAKNGIGINEISYFVGMLQNLVKVFVLAMWSHEKKKMILDEIKKKSHICTHKICHIWTNGKQI